MYIDVYSGEKNRYGLGGQLARNRKRVGEAWNPVIGNST